jgi:hypothetical protein
MRARVHASLSNPYALAPCRSVWSMAGSWLSRTAGCRLGRRLRSAAEPPVRQLACQRTAVCLATPSSVATEELERPWANSRAARSRTA